MNDPKQVKPCHIYDLSVEVLSRILAHVVQCHFYPLVFSVLSRCALRDLVNISHVDTLFRAICINTPHLWTNFPSMNACSEHFLHTVLERSYPHPFVLSFVENGRVDLNAGWGIIREHVRRLRYLNIEVADGCEGHEAGAILYSTLPELEGCIVQYHGDRNVCLDNAFLDFETSSLRLRTLDLLNCYITPSGGAPEHLSSVAIRYFGGSQPTPPSISINSCPLWTNRFQFLRHLTLWDCLEDSTAVSHSDGKLELPSLRVLVVAAPFSLCRPISEVLHYPTGCSVNVTILFPSTVELDDAETAALAGAAFIRQDESFAKCRLDLDPRAPQIRLIRATGRSVVLTFRLYDLTVVLNPIVNIINHALNLFAFFAPPIDSIDIFTYLMWDTLATLLYQRTTEVYTLHVKFPQRSTNSLLLPPMLSITPRIQTLSLSSPTTYSSFSFDWSTQHKYEFAELRQVVIALPDLARIDELAFGLAGFLDRQSRRGAPIRKIIFTVSPGLARSMGYAKDDGIRLVLSDIAQGFPSTIDVAWVEK